MYNRPFLVVVLLSDSFPSPVTFSKHSLRSYPTKPSAVVQFKLTIKIPIKSCKKQIPIVVAVYSDEFC